VIARETVARATAKGRTANSKKIARVGVEIAAAHRRFCSAAPELPASGRGRAAFSAGAVVLQEESDFRYRDWTSAPDAVVNAYGGAVVRSALDHCLRARCVPAWLAFPAGLFKASRLDGHSAESQAARVVRAAVRKKNRRRRRCGHCGTGER
jgi:hypothetical protein